MGETSRKNWLVVLQAVKYIVTLIIGAIGGGVGATMM